MSRILDSAKEQFTLAKNGENCLDSQFWHVCAGGMVQMHKVNSKVYYFPQGHAEHAGSKVDFPSSLKIPPLVICRVIGVKFMADADTDEVFVRIKLVPLNDAEEDNCSAKFNEYEDFSDSSGLDLEEKPASFAKTLTQSDANNGGGFSVPRYCAETIFPRLDYSVDPPVQIVLAKDVHGQVWKFRHIYRGTPRRHLLTTGWSTFVNQKKLVAGDSIVFLRSGNGELCVGVRRSNRANGDSSSWVSSAGGCGSSFGNSRLDGKLGNGGTGGFSIFMRGDDSRSMKSDNGGFGNSNGLLRQKNKVNAKAVIEAASLAAARQPFEVVYYPRASTPEFCVKASAVNSAMRMHWTPGMRFKMAFETEDSSRISWFMGTISSVQFEDPINWPNSPWRLLQVTWDEPDLLQNVKRVNPWLLEAVSNMPPIQISPFMHLKKKLRVSQHTEFPLEGQGILGGFPAGMCTGNVIGQMSPWQSLPANVPSSIQGARHGNYGISLSNFFVNKLQPGLFLDGFYRQDHGAVSAPVSTELIMGNSSIYDCTSVHDSLSCLLTASSSSPVAKRSTSTVNGTPTKSTPFLLFGKPILTEQQQSGVGSTDGSGLLIDTDSPIPACNSTLSRNLEVLNRVQTDGEIFSDNFGFVGLRHEKPLESSGSNGFQGLLFFKGQVSKFSSEKQGSEKMFDDGIGHCKVFMESENVGRSLDLSHFGSYEELYKTLASMFAVEELEIFGRVLYRDAYGTVRHTGDEPYSAFVKTARRLTILSDAGSDNLGRR